MDDTEAVLGVVGQDGGVGFGEDEKAGFGEPGEGGGPFRWHPVVRGYGPGVERLEQHSGVHIGEDVALSKHPEFGYLTRSEPEPDCSAASPPQRKQPLSGIRGTSVHRWALGPVAVVG